MIYLGDLSVPNQACADLLIRDMKNAGIFENETVIVNLEGVIPQKEDVDSFWKVYNHRSVVGINSVCGNLICSLANNHTYDYPEDIEYTTQVLDKNSIGYFGLTDDSGKMIPYCFMDKGERYAIFGHCWSVYTNTNPNKQSHHQISDCLYQDYYDTITKYITEHRDVRVICFLHWNFDMEELPFPSYKQLAHELIDFGVDAVIGNHAHVVQEVEMYRGKVIAYGLGNFYMPGGFYFNGKLNYPEKSHQCIAIQINKEQQVVHKFKTDCSFNVTLQHNGTELLVGGGYTV